MLVVGLIPGCITKPQNPAATQPATVIDLATTQPTYWLSQPSAEQVQGRDFDAVWEACKVTARGFGFALDRVDYRAGEITTVPLISPQVFEPWRPDTGTMYQVMANTMGAIRRTLIFDVARNADETYAITPKVLVEREVILERHVTDVSQYRLAFSGPGTKIQPREAVTLDPETYADLPVKYWYPTGRDAEMETKVAARLGHDLEKRQSLASGGTAGTSATRESAVEAVPLQADGVVSALGPDQTVYINVGVTEKAAPGMTFEVYDGRATLPTLERFAETNPQSKGWIEIVSVGNGSSTCKILRSTGAPMRQGDQIFNFIFRRGRPNRFAVAGDFVADRKMIVELIARWNGAVDAAIAPETNYLVLGTQPKEEPARQAYETARSQAEQLKIPIVSEERFNVLIRYYNPQAR
jgi:hypothetical protein